VSLKSPDLPQGFLTQPIAHRGLHASGRPENTLPAIMAAIDAGYAIEIDVQESADGVAVVFHDDTLERLTQATGPVRKRTAAELSLLTVLGTDAHVPTLAEVLAQVAGRAPLLIEVKDQSGNLGPLDGQLERAVADCLRDYAGPVALMSFNPHSMAVMAEAAPDLPRGLVTCGFDLDDWPGVPAARLAELAEIPDYGRTGASFISHQWRELNASVVTALQGQGAQVLCWTIRSTAQAEQALHIAQNITFEGFVP
jgi:glycerophosphoryl diester phosphodiesterase